VGEQGLIVCRGRSTRNATLDFGLGMEDRVVHCGTSACGVATIECAMIFVLCWAGSSESKRVTRQIAVFRSYLLQNAELRPSGKRDPSTGQRAVTGAVASCLAKTSRVQVQVQAQVPSVR